MKTRTSGLETKCGTCGGVLRWGSQLRSECTSECTDCAQANAVCMHAEQRFHRARERECGDSARIASLAFVDDLQPRVGYDMDDRVWTRQEAEALLDDIRGMYPPPLSLE